MKNILYIAPSTSVKGGIPSVIKGYLSTDLPKKHNIILVSSHVDGSKSRKLVQAILGLIKTSVYLGCNKIDIVHIHEGNIVSFKRKFYYIKLTQLFKAKIIFHHHGGALVEQYKVASGRWKDRIKKIFEEVDVVICLTQGWKNSILKLAPRANVKIISNSVILPKSYNHKNPNYAVLTFLGLIGKNKGVFDLLKVVKRLVNNGIAVQLNIAGNGEINRLHKYTTDLGIAQALCHRT